MAELTSPKKIELTNGNIVRIMYKIAISFLLRVCFERSSITEPSKENKENKSDPAVVNRESSTTSGALLVPAIPKVIIEPICSITQTMTDKVV